MDLKTAQPLLQLRGVSKRYGSFAAVDAIDLEIRQGEVFALLGPSGCGKSTTLRIIAGLEEPDEGLIRLRDKDIFSSVDNVLVPPQKRNMGMVFQSYAIWPHLNVMETVAYPLDIRRVSAADKAERARAAIRQVGLEGFEDRPSTNLSGGQQQRVALARALVYEPEILLLDEPFSNLDLRVREQMRVELKLLQRRLHIGVILVTHDQVEALTLSDRIAVMNAGRIEQIGTPVELYDSPRTAFVRDFIGAFARIRGVVKSTEGDFVTLGVANAGTVRGRLQANARLAPGDEALLAIRPEQVRLDTSDNALEARIDALLFTGDRYEAVLNCGGQRVETWLPRTVNGKPLREGDVITLDLPQNAATVWAR